MALLYTHDGRNKHSVSSLVGASLAEETVRNSSVNLLLIDLPIKERSSHVSFHSSTGVRSFAAAVFVAETPGRASQYLFCYFGAVPVQPPTNKSEERLTWGEERKRVTRRKTGRTRGALFVGCAGTAAGRTLWL